MSTTLSIRLDDELLRSLDEAAARTGKNRSEVVRKVLRGHLAIMALGEARDILVPLAEEQGWFTDEDVFRNLS